MLLALCPTTILAALSNASSPQSNPAYHLTLEEIQAFINIKKRLDPLYEPFAARGDGSAVPNHRFEQSAARSSRNLPRHRQKDTWETTGSTEGDCLSHNPTMTGGKLYQFKFLSSRCKRPGRSHFYTVACDSEFAVGPYYREFQPWFPWPFVHYCLYPDVCIDYDTSGTIHEDTDYSNTFCAHPEDIRVKSFIGVAIPTKRTRSTRPRSSVAPSWCSPTEYIPGHKYPSTSQMTTFLLTEEVSWANGSEYIAPQLYIRDSSSHFTKGFDRAFRTNDSLVSTTINVGSVRGRLQSKAVQFCMNMLTGSEVWTVMMYTWIKVNPRHGKIWSEVTSNATETDQQSVKSDNA